MENTKNNKGVITLLLIIIVILSIVCILFATGTISLNLNTLNNDNLKDNVSDNKEDEVDRTDHVELDDSVKTELKNVFEFVYNYYDFGNGYCGSYSNNDDGLPGDTNAMVYHLSSQYNSYDEMIKDLKKYMTEHVIYGRYDMSSDSYIEKDGKLYCPDYGKGGNLSQLNDIQIKYSNPYDDVIYTTIESKLTYDEYVEYESYKVTFTKKNNNWVISSYEKIVQ